MIFFALTYSIIFFIFFIFILSEEDDNSFLHISLSIIYSLLWPLWIIVIVMLCIKEILNNTYINIKKILKK